MHHQISPKRSVATKTALCTAMATALRWHALRIAVACGLALFWLTGASAASAPTPCCGVTNIAKNGEITARETNGARTFQFQVADPALRSKLRVGSPVYANFDTKQVSLDGKKSCCTMLNISTAAKQLVPGTTPAAPGSVDSGPGSTGSAATKATKSKSSGGGLDSIKPGEIPPVTASPEPSTAGAMRGRPATPDPRTAPLQQSVKLPQQISSVALNPSSVIGGALVTGTVTLQPAAGASGVTVKLQSSAPSIAAVPASTFVQPGSTSTTFIVQTYPVAANPNVVGDLPSVEISANLGASPPKTAKLTVRPPALANISTAAKQPAPDKTAAAPRSAAPTAPPAPTVSGRQTPATPATALASATQTQTAAGLIVVLEAVITDTTRRQSHAGVTGGLEDSAVVLLSGPARSVTYEQAGRGTREGPPMVLLTSSDPGVLRVPTGVAVPVGEREGKFTFITSAVGQPKDVTITATFNNASKSGKVRIVPSQLLRIEIPTPVRGGHVVQGSVVLNGPPANAASGTVKLESVNSQLVKVPNAVTVGTGQTQATFNVETFGVSQDKTVALVATLGEQGPRTASVKLLPPVLAEVDAGQSGSSWCVGPCTRNLRVVLDGKAPAGGLPLTLQSELPVHIQASATVPAGGSEVSVPFTATQVSSNKSATLSASYGGSKKRVDFTVYRLEKHDLYVRRKSEIIDRFGNVVTKPPDSQSFQMCVNVATKLIPFHTSGWPSPTALGVTYRTGGTGRSFQVPVAWVSGSVRGDSDDIDVLFVPTCFDLPGIVDGGVMDVETIADVRKELDERNEGNNDRSFKIAR